MKKSLAHLPKQKQTELMLITEKICESVPQAEMIFLYGSYARGNWVNGPHVQGRGRLTIRKRSDYDIFVVTRFACTAKDTALWDKVKAELEKIASKEYEQLALLLETPSENDNVILQQLEKLLEARAKLERLTSQHILLIRPHLSPEQKKISVGLSANSGRRWNRK